MKIIPIHYKCYVGLVLATLLWSCGTEQPAGTSVAAGDTAQINEVTLTEPQYKAIGIQLGEALREEVSTDVKVNGRVDLPPENRATVSLPIGGKIRFVEALPGQSVRKGQVLARIDSFEFIQLQQDYLQQASQLTFLEKELERQRTLSAENVGARKNYEQIQSNFASTRAQVQALDAKLRMLGLAGETLSKNGISTSVRVVSPVSGYITETYINLGKVIAPGEQLIELIDKTHMHIELVIFEQDAPFIKEGQSVRIIPASGTPIDAYVYLVGRMLEEKARTLNVHAHIRDEKQERQLIPGAYVTAYIRTGSRTALTVPPEGLVRKGTRGFVYVHEGGRRFRRIPVTIGNMSDTGNIEIIPTRVLNGEQLVIKGAYLIDAELTKRSEPAE